MATAEQAKFLCDQKEFRARRFADHLVGLTQDWIPSEQDTRRRFWEKMYEAGFKNNLEIVAIPPDFDSAKWMSLQFNAYLLPGVPL